MFKGLKNWLAAAMIYVAGVATVPVVSSITSSDSIEEVAEGTSKSSEKTDLEIAVEDAQFEFEMLQEERAEYNALPQAKDLNEILGDNFNPDEMFYYIDIIKNDPELYVARQIPELFKMNDSGYSRAGVAAILSGLEEKEEWVKVVKDNKDKVLTYNLRDFVKREEALDLVRLMGKDFSWSDAGTYSKLLEEGVDKEIIRKNRPITLTTLLRLAKDDTFPKELLGYVTANFIDGTEELTDDDKKTRVEVQRIHLEDYSNLAAGLNAIPGWDEGELRNYITEKVSERNHCYRKETDYAEGISQVEDISDIRLLYLVKGYVDYFSDKDNVETMGKVIDKDLNDPFSEAGGIVLSEKEGYKFFQVPAERELKDLRNNDAYPIPKWSEAIGKIGIFHLHATRFDDKRYCGPSGDAEISEDNEGLRYRGDLGVLRNANNPITMDCVITSTKKEGMGKGSFNVDVYFIDGLGEIKVLDLGIYSY